MFDEDHGGSFLLVNVQYEPRHILFLFPVHAGHGFIEEKKLRFQRQGPAEVNSLSAGHRQGAHHVLPDRLDLQEIQDVFHHSSMS